ncbi:MAG: protein kinase [Terrimicrobiaceae bacterium]|nr:protein kinase [Terrimicrobiaceae bacterium]
MDKGANTSAGGELQSLEFQHFTVAVIDGHPAELGRGAMGITYKAYDRNLHIHVALKVINAAVLSGENARERFLREARSAAALRHPNVAAVFFLGEQEGSVFYAMEYVEGETVEAYIRRENAMPPVLALKIVSQVASALAAAQKEGIIHRDIKPSNIMLVQSDDGGIGVKVIDFGLAKSIESAPDSATITLTQGGFLGTPHFASPEQLEEREVDTRSDIYSLGVTLYYMLAGKTPFSGSMAQVMSQHLYRQPPIEALEGQPPVVTELLAAMLAKQAEDRPQTALDLRRRVDACLEELAFTNAGGESGLGDGRPAARVAGGEVIGGRFTLGERIGSAGEFARFRAQDAGQPDRPVEVVIADPAGTVIPGLREAVRKRVSLVGGLGAPAIRKVVAQGGSGRGWFFALETLEGITLLRLMKARRSLPLAEAILILRPIAEAADSLDRAGVARSGFAPHEILLAPGSDPATPLSKWPGLAVKIDALRIEHLLDVPADGTVVQSAAAALRRESAGDPGSAAFAVAGLAYEVLGGARFDAVHDHWTPLAELSQASNLVIRRALESEFAAAVEFVKALAGEGTTVLPATRMRPAPVAEAPVAPAVESAPPPPTGIPPARRPLAPILIAVASALAAVAITLGIVFLFIGRKPAPGVAAPAAPTPPPLVRSEPNQTPAAPERSGADVTRESYREEFARAQDLEKKGTIDSALIAYANLLTAHPQDRELSTAIDRIAAKIETDHPKGLNGGDFDRLRPALEAAAAHDNPHAEVLLGNALFDSDPATGLQWLQAAAKQGRTDAMVKAGLMLSNGRGVAAPDFKAAAAWFAEAAGRNDANGMTYLADCYLRGIGVDADPKRAAELLTTAVALGDDRAMNMLGRIYEKGIGLDKSDPQKAFDLYQRAAGAGNFDAQANLGVLYIKGDGVARDPAEAVRLWKEGAEKGNTTCMSLYATSLEDENVGRNPEQARVWYIKAARAGDQGAIEWCSRNNVSLNDATVP